MRISVNQEPIPGENYLAEVEFSGAREAVDYALVAQDLTEAQLLASNAGTLLHSQQTVDSGVGDAGLWHVAIIRDGSLQRPIVGPAELQASAFWMAALVRYIRCFSEGKRTRLIPAEVFGSDTELVEAHRYFFDLRNKHVAHAVNEFEQGRFFLELPPTAKREENKGKEIRIVGGTIIARKVIEDRESLQLFLRLCERAIDFVGSAFEQSGNQAMKACESMSVAEMYEKPYCTIVVPSKNSVRIVRK